MRPSSSLHAIKLTGEGVILLSRLKLKLKASCRVCRIKGMV